MRLRRLTITKLPGIEPGFEFQPPDAGVVIVTGPNAIGKSSLARALGYLLGGVARQDPAALSLEAEFDRDGERWQATRSGGQISWRLNGTAVTAPALPSGNQMGLYRLSMESLLADDDNDEELAEEIWLNLRGGFNLDKARIQIGKQFGRKEARALPDKERDLRQIKQYYAALQADEAKLPGLDQEIDAAERARDRSGQLQQAIDLAAAIGQRTEHQVKFDAFPTDMEKLKGNEIGNENARIERLEKKAGELREKAKERQREREAAELDWQASGLADRAPQPQEMERIRQCLNDLNVSTDGRRQAEKELTKAEADLRQATAEFDCGGKTPNLGPDSLGKASRIAEPLIEACQRRKELKLQIELAGEAPDEGEIDRYRDAVRALRSWLAADEQDPQPTQIANGPIYTALVLTAVTGLLSLLTQAWLVLPGVAATAVALLWALSRRRQGRPGPSPIDAAEAAFAKTGVEAPESWCAQDVEAHLRDTVEKHLNELTLRRDHAAGVPGLRLQVAEIEPEIKQLERQKAELAREIGFDPELPTASFDRFIRLAERWDEAQKSHVKAQADFERVDGKIEKSAAEARAFLESWRGQDTPPFDDTGADSAIEELKIAFGELETRVKLANDARTKMDLEGREIDSLNKQLAENDKDIESIYTEVGLETAERGELEQRLGRLEDWREAKGALRDCENEEKRLRRELESDTDLTARAENGEDTWLEGELERARRKADSHTDLIEERKGIKTRLEEAGREHKLEQAAAAFAGAESDLADKRDEALRWQATELLLDEIDQEFKSQHEPELLRKAKDGFSQVTAGEFRLELGDKQRFAAWDVKQEQLRALTELSTGTRMQLLLALRLAWAEAQERGGAPLPLFLDEALTTSDEERFKTMAESLSRLAESGGRQIFYLSARRHESALWRQKTDAEPAVVDLAEVRFQRGQLVADDYQIEIPPPPPPPGDQDAASYAASLGVRPINPRLEPGGIHLFHLLRNDLKLLHRLLALWRIASLGQLESLLASNAAAGAIPQAEFRDRLTIRCRAARAWTELWRRGRGRPVDRGALEQSGAVSERFIDRATTLAAEHDGDGSALIGALGQGRLRRFHTNKIGELQQWLADEGYTDPRGRLSAEERRREILAELAPSSDAEAADLNQLVSWLDASAQTQQHTGG